jgi:hypothetical protein
VTLTVVNALRDYKGARGLIDDLGDARMPSIVPLNTEPQWEAAESETAGGPWTFTQKDGTNVRPSSRLALMLPLPTSSYTNAIARPFGINETGTLAGLASDATTLSMDEKAAPGQMRTAQIEQMTFYAGRAAAKGSSDLTTVEIDENEIEAFQQSLITLLAGPLQGRRIDQVVIDRIDDEAQQAGLNFAGRQYRLTLTLSDGSNLTMVDAVGDDATMLAAVNRL